MDSSQKDNSRLKNELTPLKDRLRDLEQEYNTVVKRIDERGERIATERFLIEHNML